MALASFIGPVAEATENQPRKGYWLPLDLEGLNQMISAAKLAVSIN